MNTRYLHKTCNDSWQVYSDGDHNRSDASATNEFSMNPNDDELQGNDPEIEFHKIESFWKFVEEIEKALVGHFFRVFPSNLT